jgi:hypothetical protein
MAQALLRDAPQLVVGARGLGGRLAQHLAEERVALLGDWAEVLFVGRGVDHRREADAAHDVLSIRESRDGAEDDGRWSARSVARRPDA